MKHLEFMSFTFEDKDFKIITKEPFFSILEYEKGIEKYGRVIEIYIYRKSHSKKEPIAIYRYNWKGVHYLSLRQLITFFNKFATDISFRSKLLFWGEDINEDLSDIIQNGFEKKTKDEIKSFYKTSYHKRTKLQLREISVYGKDKYSYLSKVELSNLISKNKKNIIDDLLLQDISKISAYRWCLRGFEPFDAIRKVMEHTNYKELKPIEDFINHDSIYIKEFNKTKDEVILEKITKLLNEEFTYKEIAKKLDLSNRYINKYKEIIEENK